LISRVVSKPKDDKEYPEKMILIERISQYRDRFPEVRLRVPKPSIKNQLADLKYLERQCERILGTQGGKEILLASTVLGVSIAEQLVPYVIPCEIKGTSNDIAASAKILSPVLDELVIKYSEMFEMGPEKRFVALILQIAHNRHKLNTDPEYRALFERAQAAQATGEENVQGL
jgi:hypothetical protein